MSKEMWFPTNIKNMYDAIKPVYLYAKITATCPFTVKNQKSGIKLTKKNWFIIIMQLCQISFILYALIFFMIPESISKENTFMEKLLDLEDITVITFPIISTLIVFYCHKDKIQNIFYMISDLDTLFLKFDAKINYKEHFNFALISVTFLSLNYTISSFAPLFFNGRIKFSYASRIEDMIIAFKNTSLIAFFSLILYDVNKRYKKINELLQSNFENKFDNIKYPLQLVIKNYQKLNTQCIYLNSLLHLNLLNMYSALFQTLVNSTFKITINIISKKNTVKLIYQSVGHFIKVNHYDLGNLIFVIHLFAEIQSRVCKFQKKKLQIIINMVILNYCRRLNQFF